MDGSDQVVIIAGEDRPGILDDVCGVIQRNSGVIVNIRSIDIAGQFSMIVQVKVREGARAALEHQLGELAGYSGLFVRMKPADPSAQQSNHLFRLVACGREDVGVLKKLSHLLRVLSINIEHVDTHSEPDGSTTMSLVMAVPRECPVTKLREFVGQLLCTMEMKWELTSV
jgi:glycine cleavage system regulatory protein